MRIQEAFPIACQVARDGTIVPVEFEGCLNFQVTQSNPCVPTITSPGILVVDEFAQARHQIVPSGEIGTELAIELARVRFCWEN
jgi:hypothetical protein